MFGPCIYTRYIMSTQAMRGPDLSGPCESASTPIHMDEASAHLLEATKHATTIRGNGSASTPKKGGAQKITIGEYTFELTEQNIQNLAQLSNNFGSDLTQFEEACTSLGVQQEWFQSEWDRHTVIQIVSAVEVDINHKALASLSKRQSGHAQAFFAAVVKSYTNAANEKVSVNTEAARFLNMYQGLKKNSQPSHTIISHEQNGSNWMFRLVNSVSNVEKTCLIEARLELSLKDLSTIAMFICNQHTDDETHFTACMQIDTHRTRHTVNSPWIGMSLTVTTKTRELNFPIDIISADIGCGLSVFPMVISGQHIDWNTLSSTEQWELSVKFMLAARLNLIRGNSVEEGSAKPNISQFIRGCSKFLAKADGILPIDQFADQLYQLLQELHFDTSAPHLRELIDIGADQHHHQYLTVEQSIALNYMFGYLCSLGSAGNHFAEMAFANNKQHTAPTTGKQVYTVVHSGSRGFGAKIFDAIRFLCVVRNGAGIATNDLSDMYSRAYDLLQQVAFYNRFMCVNAIYSGMGNVDCNAETIRDALFNSDMLAQAEPSIRNNLIKGMIHNGLSAFVDHDTQRVAIILKKGSIAMSNGAGIGFVALSPGAGCVAFIMNDPTVKFREVSLSKAKECITSGYNLCDFTEIQGEIGTYGHGAGRPRGATESSKQIHHGTVFDHANTHCYMCNIGPGIYGDGPGAYRTPDIDLFGENATQLQTIVSFKECISHVPDDRQKFVRGVVADFNEHVTTCRESTGMTLTQVLSSPQMAKAVNTILGLDLILAKNSLYGDRIAPFFVPFVSDYNALCELQTSLIETFVGSQYVHSGLRI